MLCELDDNPACFSPESSADVARAVLAACKRVRSGVWGGHSGGPLCRNMGPSGARPDARIAYCEKIAAAGSHTGEKVSLPCLGERGASE